MMSTPEVEPSPQQPAYLDAPQNSARIWVKNEAGVMEPKPLPAEVAAPVAANLHRMLPLCAICNERVPLSGALHDGKAWQCLWHTAVSSAPVNLVVNGVLMPAPEPTRSQKLAAAGFKRRPSWRCLPKDGDD